MPFNKGTNDFFPTFLSRDKPRKMDILIKYLHFQQFFSFFWFWLLSLPLENGGESSLVAVAFEKYFPLRAISRNIPSAGSFKSAFHPSDIELHLKKARFLRLRIYSRLYFFSSVAISQKKITMCALNNLHFLVLFFPSPVASGNRNVENLKREKARSGSNLSQRLKLLSWGKKRRSFAAVAAGTAFFALSLCSWYSLTADFC